MVQSGKIVFLGIYFKATILGNMPGVQGGVAGEIGERDFPKNRSVGGLIIFIQSDKLRDIFLTEHEKSDCLTAETETGFFLVGEFPFGDERVDGS